MLQLLEVVLCYVICRHIVVVTLLTRQSQYSYYCIISNNTIAVTLVVFLYFQMILGTCMIDQHLNFINLKIEISISKIRARINLARF